MERNILCKEEQVGDRNTLLRLRAKKKKKTESEREKETTYLDLVWKNTIRGRNY